VVRVCFFGTPEFALPSLQGLLDAGHEVAPVVTQPDRPRGRGQKLGPSPVKRVALAAGLPVLQPERLKEPAFLEAVADASPDLGVVVAYGRILPAALLGIPRHGFLNVHASLLPRYRGAAPVQRAVIAGEAETGVTIMRVVPALDAGPMLAVRGRPIARDETSLDVERDLARLGAAQLIEVIDDLAAGRAIETPQDETAATHAPRLVRQEGLIDWSLPAPSIHNLVRGLHPWPHAHTFLAGRRYLVLRTAVLVGGEGQARPGTILAAGRDGLRVVAGHGTSLLILSIQPEGRRAMDAREFLAGHPVEAGATFGRAADDAVP
jgi:methionyl-tRNA formyltransferase